jgi:hypothetical protein
VSPGINCRMEKAVQPDFQTVVESFTIIESLKHTNFAAD